ncbi:MAG: alpha/beta fold hydrolase, partial [Candidatus Sericytochromatia bacterium]
MNTTYFLAALTAGTLLLAGCQSPAVPVEPEGAGAGTPISGEIDFSNRPPAPLSTKLDVVYSTVENQSLTMDLYYPNVVTAKTPTVLYIHSGGWYQGDKSLPDGTVYGAVRDALLARGIAVVSINYRLVPAFRFPAQIEDVRAALGYLAEHQERLAIDPERVAVMGASSGGHLAALAGLVGPDETPEGETVLRHRPKAVVSMYGVLDLEAAASKEFSGIAYRLAGMIANATRVPVGTASPVLTQNSPTTYASADDPPIWLTHGDADTLVPPAQSAALHQRMRAAGGRSTLVSVKGANHGYNMKADTVPKIPDVVSQIEA